MSISLLAKKADITTLDVDAIVNAANQSLLGGSGVDGAIHRAAGPALLDACRRLNGCPTGQAKITPGFKLPAKYVIHTVGPVWQGGGHHEADLLARCYRNSLQLALDNRLHSIAFPAISAGSYGFPVEQAARIAIDTVSDFAHNNEHLQKVVFCCFSDSDLQLYLTLLAHKDR